MPAEQSTSPSPDTDATLDTSSPTGPAAASNATPHSETRKAAPASGGGSALFGAVVTIVILGVAGAGAWVSRDHWWAYVEAFLPPMEDAQEAKMLARVNALEDHIATLAAPENDSADTLAFAELQQERDKLTSELSTVMARLEAVEASLESVERMANAVTVGDAGAAITRQSIQDITDRLASLEDGGNGNSGAGDAPALANLELDSVLARLQTVEDQARAIESAAESDMAVLARVQSKIDAMESRPVPRSASGMVDKSVAAALVLGIGQLRDAVHRGAPYTDSLDAVTAAGAQVTDAAPHLKTLRVHAATGVSTLLNLQQSFGDAADLTFDAAMAASEPDSDDTWLAQTLRQVKSIVRIRDTDASAKPGSVESHIARAENYLLAGDLSGATLALVDLEGTAAAAMSGWLGSARARLAVDDSLARLHTMAIERMVVQSPDNRSMEGSADIMNPENSTETGQD